MNKEIYQILFDVEENHWWFIGRKKILAVVFKKFIPKVKNPLLILDVGCSTGMTSKFLAEYGRVCGVDLSSTALEFCRKQNFARVIQADANNLPFLDESYDVLVALDLLEHLNEDRRGLREFSRVLKKDGYLIISAPAHKFLWSNFDISSYHFRRYRLKELKEKINQADFEIEKISYFNCFLFFGILAARLYKNFFKSHIELDYELRPPVKIINTILKKIFCCEANFINRFNFPFGLSVFCVARKKAL